MQVEESEMWSFLCAVAFILMNLLLFVICAIRFLIRRRARNRLVIGVSVALALAGAACSFLARAHFIATSVSDWLAYSALAVISLVATVLIIRMSKPSQ